IAAQQEVGDPHGEAVHDHGIGGRAGVAHPRHQIVRLLERAPVPRPLGTVSLDAMGHVAVAGLGRRHEGHACPRKMAVDGEAALAATRATENESRRSHARVLPRRPSRKVRARAGLLALGSSYSPRLPGLRGQWLLAGFVPDYSDGVAADLHRLPKALEGARARTTAEP